MGPETEISKEIHSMKYCLKGESFREQTARLAHSMKDSEEHYYAIKEIIRNQRFLFAGRIQSDMGSPRATTAFNCFVSGTIEDSMGSIMDMAKEAAETMRRGGGIGYDFSKIRPRGDRIKSLDSISSGPVSFMHIYNAVCKTISSAGHRRGAQMAALRIDHPDIEEFIRCKRNKDAFTDFNISVAVTDEFMKCLEDKTPFELRFDGKSYGTIDPENLWDEIMRANWDWAEPGVLFIDTINKYNNLWYCETIAATNPCGEQPLPPYGACLLGSFNLTQYVQPCDELKIFDNAQFEEDIAHVVRALDNVIDRTSYPLPEQELEAKNKRRMGIGITGVADAGAALGYEYGTPAYLRFQSKVLSLLSHLAYSASSDLAVEKGSFPLYDPELYLQGNYIKGFEKCLTDKIKQQGIRNSHLISLAPTGTISLSADNISSSIEPPYMLTYDRTIKTFDGVRIETVQDYAIRQWGIKPKTANEVTASEHVDVLCAAQEFVDSAISKTCNVGDNVKYEDFKQLYIQAYKGGAKGCTTFRASGKRYGILNPTAEHDVDEQSEQQDETDTVEAMACFIDPATGSRTCE